MADKSRNGGPWSSTTSISQQLVHSTVVVQSLLVVGLILVFLAWMYNDQIKRRKPNLQAQSETLAQSARYWVQQDDTNALDSILGAWRRMPSLATAQVVDTNGNVLASTDRNEVGKPTYADVEDDLHSGSQNSQIIGGGHGIVAVSPIVVDGKVIGAAVVVPNWRGSVEQQRQAARIGILYGVLAILANALASIFIARRVSAPILRLAQNTERVAGGADISTVFPLPQGRGDEVGRLTAAYNAMADTLERQRAGLNDTLSLLDFMLTNAPIGFAFFDRECHIVRVNQNVADMCGVPIALLVGREVTDPALPAFAQSTQQHIDRVFATGEPVRDVEMTGVPPGSDAAHTWLANFFPVEASNTHARWVGLVLVEVTQSRLAEEAMRRTEKLAAAGRMAASIAHEINNPLEGVTNLLYLLNSQPLDDESKRYVDMAEHELRRVSEITQQTLRFYRSSAGTGPVSLQEITSSILSLYHGRLLSVQVDALQRHRETPDIIGYSGELRQLIANLIGNAIDACSAGAKLAIRTRRATSGGHRGVRLTVADSGCGMTPEVRKRIFEPFYTTKEATGTGLGLWISAEILAKHHATMQVRSRSGSGTVFSIFFPEAPAA